MEILAEIAQKPKGFVDYKLSDDIGRSRAYCRGSMSSKEFIEICKYLDSRLISNQCSRWSARGIVKDDIDLSSLIGIASPEAPIEVNRLPVNYNGQQQQYVWISRNSPSRSVNNEIKMDFINTLSKRIEFQQRQKLTFMRESEEMFDLARKSGLKLVCNDPFGEWGESRIKAKEFHNLIGSFFYGSEETASQMAEGRGYSTYHHYLFGIRSSSGELLGVFVLAKWPWGFEGTYTMVKPDRLVAKLGIAKLMMLSANALLLSRYGDNHLIYGEANTANCRPCIQAGYDIIPVRLGEADANIHENVIWADNPIGEYSVANTDSMSLPPTHLEQSYVNYALMRLDSTRVMPFIQQAYNILSVY